MGLEVKYFALTLEGALSYARQAARSYAAGPFSVFKTSIAEDQLQPSMQLTVDGGIPTVVLPTRSLRGLSQAVMMKSTVNESWP